MKRDDKKTVDEYLNVLNNTRSQHKRAALQLGWCAGVAHQRMDERRRAKARRKRESKP